MDQGSPQLESKCEDFPSALALEGGAGQAGWRWWGVSQLQGVSGWWVVV